MVFVIPFGMLPIFSEQVQIVTENGNVFSVDADSLNSESTGSGNGINDGQAMIDGIGLQSRIIQTEYDDGQITYGSGMVGADTSMVPYFQVPSSTDFAAMTVAEDAYSSYVIPKFAAKYNFVGDSLVMIPDNTPNVLGYSVKQDILGNTAVTVNNGLDIAGMGTTVLKLNDMNEQTVLINGDATNGKVQLVKSPYDLTALPYSSDGFETYSETQSYQKIVDINSNCWYTNAYNYCIVSENPQTSSTNTRPISSIPNILVGQDQQIVSKYEFSQDGWGLVDASHHSYHCHSSHKWSQQTAIDKCLNTLSGSTSQTVHPTYSVFDPLMQYYTVTSLSGIIDEKVDAAGFMRIYDQRPFVEIFEAQNQEFNHKHTFGNDDYYLIIESANLSGVDIKGINIQSSSNLLEISNIPPNKHFQITQNGVVGTSGVTGNDGMLVVLSSGLDLSGSDVGILNIYESLVHRDTFDTVVFDGYNDETFRIDTADSKTYVIHAYAKIPVVGTVNVTGTNLDGTQSLSYLDRQYVGGAIYIPVVPGFSTINMTINGVAASLDYSDILGGTGIKIADPVTSTISEFDAESPILSGEATVGTTAYAIATSNGVLNAQITQTISGVLSITNTYNLEAIPPPPPPIPSRDPLSGWVDVYVNGVLVKQQTLGINPFPNFIPANDVNGNVVTRSVTYTYPDYSLSGSVSVDVSSGDVVEFYVYAKISGDIDGYAPPAGFALVSSSGVSSATASIRDAYVFTSM